MFPEISSPVINVFPIHVSCDKMLHTQTFLQVLMAQLSFQSFPLFTMFCKDAEYMEPLYLTLKHVTFFKETPNEEINCIFKYLKPAVSFLN